jgi:hypothetical protein
LLVLRLKWLALRGLVKCSSLVLVLLVRLLVLPRSVEHLPPHLPPQTHTNQQATKYRQHLALIPRQKEKHLAGLLALLALKWQLRLMRLPKASRSL